jgi:hypothetical protein
MKKTTMTPAEHKQKAEEHLEKAGRRGGDTKYHLKAAEIHATLARPESNQAEQ